MTTLTFTTQLRLRDYVKAQLSFLLMSDLKLWLFFLCNFIIIFSFANSLLISASITAIEIFIFITFRSIQMLRPVLKDKAFFEKQVWNINSEFFEKTGETFSRKIYVLKILQTKKWIYLWESKSIVTVIPKSSIPKDSIGIFLELASKHRPSISEIKHNERKKYKLSFRAISIASVLIILIIKIVIAVIDNHRAGEQYLPSTYTLPSDYLRLISPKYKDSITVEETHQSKVRTPISVAYFTPNYQFTMLKIGFPSNISLETIFTEENKSTRESTGYTYGVIYNDFNKFYVKFDSTPIVSKIYLAMSGDSLQTFIKNDSIVYSHLLCDNLSIRYMEDGPNDIFCEGNSIPTDLLFIKRDKAVYILLMTPNVQQAYIPPYLLYNIVTGGG